MEKLIRSYVQSVAESLAVNIMDIADSVFDKDPLVTEEKNLVVPELGDITPAKRNVVKEIVLKKTGYHIEPAYDMFLDHLVVYDKAVTSDGN